MKKILLITAVVLLLYCVLGWFTGSWLDLAGARLWIFRVAFWLIGIFAAGFAVWFFWNKKKREEAENAGLDPAGMDDLGSLIRDARNKLRSAGHKPGDLPVVFVVGEAESAKTTTVVQSGIHPEQLAGQVSAGGTIIPTPVANFWYAEGAVFAEAAGASLDEPKSWRRIAESLQPRGLGAAVRNKGTAPSAALIAFDAGKLMEPGAAEAIKASARRMRDRLIDISQALGVQLPVYVLFTKTDKIPFFVEFTRNLRGDESGQILGATLAMRTGAEGVYANDESVRLSAEFDALLRSLAGWRPVVLDREQDAANLPASYQFPRELRKLRPLVVQFLVDLCRPNQLSVGPVLRGFYFAGARPTEVTEAAPANADRGREAQISGGTQFFRQDSGPMAARAAVTRRVPEWIFLSQFFHRVLLADQGARGASGSSTRTSFLRRVLLGSVCAASLLYGIALSVSYVRNRALAAPWREAASIEAAGAAAGSVEALRHLETLRGSMATIGYYRREGSPLGMRWGLNTVDDLHPHARAIYFEEFRKLLLAPTRAAIVRSMKGLPPTATAAGPEYQPTYDALKAYLITTTHPEKTSRELAGVLQRLLPAQPAVSAERQALALRQFEFYSEELKSGNPLSADNDKGAIASGRRYLNSFGGVERVYAAMLSDAGKGTAPVNFNKTFEKSAETVVDSYEVPAAFTKTGWDAMRKSIKAPDAYFKGESWVLGEQGAGNLDFGTVSAKLESRYESDFLRHWRAYLTKARVLPYANLQDAAKKLEAIASNQSTVLALFSLASLNTDVDVPEVKRVFQPVQSVVPPGGPVVGPANQKYGDALLDLQMAVKAAAEAPDKAGLLEPVEGKAKAALMVVGQSSMTFTPDAEGVVDKAVKKLMEDPINFVSTKPNPDPLGKDICAKLHDLDKKYPFNPKKDAPQATLDDVNGFFRPPDGTLWADYAAGLNKVLVKPAARYEAAPTAQVNPAFVRFFNDAAHLSDVWYAKGSKDPHFTYTLKPVPSDNPQSVRLELDGQAFAFTGGTVAAKEFEWKAADPHGAKATIHDLGWPSKSGLWAVFQFFADAEKSTVLNDTESLEWVVRISGQPAIYDGKPVTLRLELSIQGAPPAVFREGWFKGLGCVGQVTAK